MAPDLVSNNYQRLPAEDKIPLAGKALRENIWAITLDFGAHLKNFCSKKTNNTDTGLMFSKHASPSKNTHATKFHKLIMPTTTSTMYYILKHTYVDIISRQHFLDNRTNSTNLYPPTKGYLRETCKSQNINPIYLTHIIQIITNACQVCFSA